jgi:hypothetical protein
MHIKEAPIRWRDVRVSENFKVLFTVVAIKNRFCLQFGS